jgi:hypothetical protein
MSLGVDCYLKKKKKKKLGLTSQNQMVNERIPHVCGKK